MSIENRILKYVEQINPENLGLNGKIESVRLLGTGSGESNKVYFLDINSSSFLLKMNGVGGKDHEFFRKEFLKLKALEPFSIAPKAFVYDEIALDGQSMILEMIPGRTAKSEEIPTFLDQITSTINRMVSISAEELRKNQGFKRYINSCLEYAKMFPRHATKQLGEYDKRFGHDEAYKIASESISNAGIFIEYNKDAFNNTEMGLIHTGLHAGNIILTPESRIRLVDWEHSGIGDRAFEISSLFRSNNLSLEQQRAVYSEYSGKTGEFEERVEVYTEIFKIHEVLWNAIRYDKARKGEINLDQNKNMIYYSGLFQKHLSVLKQSRLQNVKL